MQETKVQSLGWQDPLEEEVSTHSSILAWKIPWTERSLVGCSPWDHNESDTTERLSIHACIISWQASQTYVNEMLLFFGART